MKSCAFEKEVSLALREGRWPTACDAALHDHIVGCSSCSDLVLVTDTLQHSRAYISQAALLPPPGVLYWRAQIRRRNGAVERMSRPIVFAEVATLAAALFAFALAVYRWIDFVDWTSLRDHLPFADSRFHLADALAALPSSTPLLIAALVFFVLGGLAVYVLAHSE
jgi:hypothetical protein